MEMLEKINGLARELHAMSMSLDPDGAEFEQEEAYWCSLARTAIRWLHAKEEQENEDR